MDSCLTGEMRAARVADFDSAGMVSGLKSEITRSLMKERNFGRGGKKVEAWRKENSTRRSTRLA